MGKMDDLENIRSATSYRLLIWTIRIFLLSFLLIMVLLSAMALGVSPHAVGPVVAALIFVGAAAIVVGLRPLTIVSAMLRDQGGMQIDGQLAFFRNFGSDLLRVR
ncbi:hypothetical protein [Micromonospora sp. CP22]|uniref:hypothetical protein n=1 Tax=Micromonospora sp. CP22 TaxID=2580517 RepID=UPI0012BC3F4E|nr:hypothetical protein [Micromonospora sp. CP22]MTK05459.1 hypothetical protein [Micromonospora sp. CP22]